MRGDPVIQPKFLQYQYIETVLLHIDGYYTGGQPLNTNERAFFDPTSIQPGRRVIGIEVVSNAANFFYNGVNIIPIASLLRFTLTMQDLRKKALVRDMPINELHRSVSFGYTRIFDLIPDMANCFVTNTFTPIATTNQGILFTFYTVDAQWPL